MQIKSMTALALVLVSAVGAQAAATVHKTIDMGDSFDPGGAANAGTNGFVTTSMAYTYDFGSGQTASFQYVLTYSRPGSDTTTGIWGASGDGLGFNATDGTNPDRSGFDSRNEDEVFTLSVSNISLSGGLVLADLNLSLDAVDIKNTRGATTTPINAGDLLFYSSATSQTGLGAIVGDATVVDQALDSVAGALDGYTAIFSWDSGAGDAAVRFENLDTTLTMAPDNRPNVIIIYSDDHGYCDLGFFGTDSNLQTPNMDALASGGALMTQGYASAPQCRPSRCGLMAGRIQNEFGFMSNNSNVDGAPKSLPRIYPPGSDMAGQPLLTIADRMKALGYVTGFSGKWHCGDNNDNNPAGDGYDPRDRGFDEYCVNSTSPFWANYEIAGDYLGPIDPGSSPPKTDALLSPNRELIQARLVEKFGPNGGSDYTVNRVTAQGMWCEKFVERNTNNPFFLYFPIYGPHVPLIATNDPYYVNFPVQNYPHYDAGDDDVRRKGLAMLKAIDDAIGDLVQKVRDMGIEENTLILFCGDNGAPLGIQSDGTPEPAPAGSWNGSENIPLRGVKGHLLEGGIRVPMFAYWKGTIAAGQVIDEMVTALDFTATTVAAGGGAIPSEFDGVDIIPRLTGQESSITRTTPMFWDFDLKGEQVVRKGDWKLWRNATNDRLFNIADDPMELFDLSDREPAKAAELGADLDAWCTPLTNIQVVVGNPTAKNTLGAESSWGISITGNTVAAADPRYLVPYGNPVAMPYPAAVLKVGATPPTDTDGDGASDTIEYDWNRNPFSAIDGTIDADADGESDLFEMIAGYSPDNGSDVFTSNVGGTPSNTVQITYDGKEGRTYVVEASTNLVAGGWEVLGTNGPVVSDGSQVIAEPVETNRFYRFKVSYP